MYLSAILHSDINKELKIFFLFTDTNITYYWFSNNNTNEGKSNYFTIKWKCKEVYTPNDR